MKRLLHANVANLRHCNSLLLHFNFANLKGFLYAILFEKYYLHLQIRHYIYHTSPSKCPWALIRNFLRSWKWEGGFYMNIKIKTAKNLRFSIVWGWPIIWVLAIGWQNTVCFTCSAFQH